MFTKDVKKELIKIAQTKKDLARTNDAITDVNRLLEYDNQKDLDIFRKLSPRSTMQRAENQLGAIIDLEKDEEFHGGNIFSQEQIILLAKKYRLKFLSSTRYIGDMDQTIPIEIRSLEDKMTESHIRERAKRENITIQEYKDKNSGYQYKFDASDYQNKFFILAPPSCFILKTEKIAQKIVWTDPILFFRTNDGRYRLIKKWGNDFTIFRRLLGIVYKNNEMFKFFICTLPIMILFSVASILLAVFVKDNFWIIPLATACLILPAIQWPDTLKAEAFTDGGWCTSDKNYSWGSEKIYKSRGL